MVTLDGKVMLITGAASGLGAALTAVLLEAGAQVIMVDRQADRLAAVRERADPQGHRTRDVVLDLRDREAVIEAMAQMSLHFGGLDVLINNAGTDVTASIEALTLENWDDVMATNLTAPFLLSKLALPLLRARRGQIVNIASTAAKRAWPNASAYHASKWGLTGLSHALHAELRTDAIRVMSVVVGGMRTPFLLDRFEGLDLARLQDPGNVARAIAFALTMPVESTIPELMVLPRQESSWP